MLEQEDIDKVDKAGLWKAYQEWPEAVTRALGARLALPEGRLTRMIVLAGMGGSGAACDIVGDWVGLNSGTPALVVKDFHLPRFVGPESLVMAVSLSGDTKEVLSVAEEARARGCDVVAISSGGALEAWCKEEGVPHNRVERLLVPRASLPGMVVTALRILDGLGLADCEADLKELPSALRQGFSQVAPSVPANSNPAKKIALLLQGKRASIYTPAPVFSVGSHFRASMNENAKLPVYAGAYPEIFHNEIETWKWSKERSVIILRKREENETVSKKLARSKSLLRRAGVPVSEVYDFGNSIVNLLSWCLLLDMVSIYVAVLGGTTPIATPLLDGARKL